MSISPVSLSLSPFSNAAAFEMQRLATLQQMQFTDGHIRRQVDDALSQGAPGAVSSSVTYSKGPDGRNYAVDAYVTSTRRIGGPIEQANNDNQQAQSNNPLSLFGFPPKPKSLADFLPPDVELSPDVLASLQSQPQRNRFGAVTQPQHLLLNAPQEEAPVSQGETTVSNPFEQVSNLYGNNMFAPFFSRPNYVDMVA